jgi:gliding motility-associated-like protein
MYTSGQAQIIADFCFCDNSNPPNSFLINAAGADATAVGAFTGSNGEGLFNTAGENINVRIPAAIFEGAESITLEFDVRIQEGFAWLINAGLNRFRLAHTIFEDNRDQGLWLRYYTVDENGQVTEIDTGPINEARLPRGERATVGFTYDKEEGTARLYIDNELVWETPQENRTPGEAFYLNAENNAVIVADNMNGSGSIIPSIYGFRAYKQSCPVVPPPVATDAERCDMGTLTLEATSGIDGSFQWYDQNRDRIEGATEATFTTPALQESTTYYVSVTDGPCESELVPVEAVVYTIPDAPVINDVEKCEAAIFSLEASGGQDGYYRWYDQNMELIAGEQAATLTTSFLEESTNFYVSLVNEICEGPLSEVRAIIRTVPEPPQVAGAEHCGSGSLRLQAEGGAAGDYRWYDSNMERIDGTVGATLDTPALSETATFYVSISNGYCESEKVAVEALIKPIPAPPEAADVESCSGSGVTLQASGGAEGSYRWYDAAGNLLDGENSAQYSSPLLNASTTYSVAWVQNGCESSRKEISVTIHPLPVSPSPHSLGICGPGEADFAPLLDNQSTYRWYASPDAAEFIHEGSAGSFQPYIEQDTVLYVSVWSGYCESERVPMSVEVYDIPSFEAGEEVYLLPDEQVVLQASSGFVDYQWLPAEGLSNATVANPIASPEQTTRYTVSARTADGCQLMDEVLVNVVDNFPVPNAFTPNNDQLNDYWEIPLAYKYPGFEVFVFDRWGKLVFSSQGYDNPWDGALPDGNILLGTYLYRIYLGEGKKPRTGKVTVLQ